MIGLSLSLCVKDVLDGRVAEEDVSLVVTGTRAVTPWGWRQLLDGYRDLYWSRTPDAAEALVERWRAAGKVFEVRAFDPEAEVNIAEGYWVKDGRLVGR